MKKHHLLIGTWIILLIKDQLSKYAVRSTMVVGESIPVIKDVFHITYVQNTGAVFGSMHGMNSWLIWLSIMGIGFLMYFWDKFPSDTSSHFFLTMILVGLCGNLIDRVFLGYVTDFMDFRFWPVFNVADSAVSIGVVGFVLRNIKK